MVVGRVALCDGGHSMCRAGCWQILTDRATLGWHSTGGSQPSIDGVDVSIDGSQSIIRCVLEGTPNNKRICGRRPFAEEIFDGGIGR
jgi:hypothetical protein